VRVILSGHETPGEGEHKIMDFIRYEKSQPDYDPNTRHCLYGLDADLIVLGLCSHEPHFSLLREEVKFLKSKPGSKQTARSVNPDVITFHLLHLSLLRNYLDHEFSELRTKLTFGYNIENIIDDWILMGFLVGNDFIPHIPHFHINKNSLVALYRVYMDVMPSLDGYLNENGVLNLSRFEQFLKKVAEIDEDNFMETFADVKYLESKSANLKKKLTRFYDDEDGVDQEISVSKRFAALEVCDDEDVGYNETVTPDGSDEEQSSESGESDTLNEEFTLHKQRYYETKLELEKVDADALHEQAVGYIRAIQWNLHYYYNGCVSWSWFYPHHYAPYISDVRDFASADLTFERGKPFKPFEQLLAVLPAASKDLLPRAFQRLLTDSNSPIIRHYPENFELDMNEKQQEWEAVVKISFIDEKELLEAADQCSLLFSSKEKERNIHGPHTEFTFTPDRQPSYKSPLPFLQDVAISHALVRDIDIDLYRIKPQDVRHGLASGVKLDLHFPGFPTLHFVPHDHRLSREKVKVFEMCSQGDNMILSVKNREAGDILQLAHECLGKSVFINWPHLLEAKVENVCDFTFMYTLDENGQVKQSSMDDKQMKEIASTTKNIARHYKERKGIEIGVTDAVLACYPITGRKYVPTAAGTVSFEKQWSSILSYAPFQLVVKDIAVFDDSFIQYKTIDEIYPVGARCFVLAPSYYGHSARVIEPPSTSIKVSITCTAEPDLSEVVQMESSVLKDHYHPNYVMAQRLGIGGHVVARLTGTVFVTSGNAKINIGLGLRYNSRGLEVPGFSRKVDEVWLFSNEVADILNEYNDKFPEVIQNLSCAGNKDAYAVKDLFPDENGYVLTFLACFHSPLIVIFASHRAQRVKELNQWLKSLPCNGVPKQKIGAQVLDQCVVKYIEKLLNTFWVRNSPNCDRFSSDLIVVSHRQ
jgi:5'-3' exoribonuclease 1